MQNQKKEIGYSMSEVYFIVSGKGGVGKSTIAAALGCSLAEQGTRAIILDADIGLRSQDALLGVESRVVYDILDVINGECQVSQALLSAADVPGLSLLPAAQFARAKDMDGKDVRKVIRSLQESFDYLLIDCPAGIERGVRNIVNAGTGHAILIVTPDDLCLRDAERVSSLLADKGFERPQLIVNRLQKKLIQQHEMYTAQTVASLLDLPLLGEIPEDPAVYRSQVSHQLLIKTECEAKQAVVRISGRLRGQSVPFPRYGEKVPFFSRRFTRLTNRR